jgi:hypothetical protein
MLIEVTRDSPHPQANSSSLPTGYMIFFVTSNHLSFSPRVLHWASKKSTEIDQFETLEARYSIKLTSSEYTAPRFLFPDARARHNDMDRDARPYKFRTRFAYSQREMDESRRKIVSSEMGWG